MSRATAVVLAVLLPVVIVAGSVAGLERFRGFEDAREARNAGQVINGRVVDGNVAQMIDRTLADKEAEVIILGNSLCNTDIKPVLLAERLGLPKHKVQRVSLPHSIGAHWYAILKNRVYGNGHAPKLVIVLADMQSTLAVAPPSEASQQNLRVQMGEFEPVIHHKMGRQPNYAIERVRENRTQVRDRMLKVARNFMVDLLVHRTLTSTPRNKTEASLNRVFHASKTDMRLHGDVIPTFGTTDMTVAFDPESLPVPGRSFLPEITELVAANGGHAVFLRPPMSPLLAPNVGDIVSEDSERKAHRMVGRLGGTYLDLRRLDMDDGQFHNVDHMNPEGARRLTEVTVAALVELGVWRHQGVPVLDLLQPVTFEDGVLLPREPVVEPRGRPPAVPRNQRPIEVGRRGVAFMLSDALSPLADDALLDVSPFGSRCSPVRVLEDGVPLPHHNRTCEEVARHRQGRVCHNPEKIFFTPADSSDPLTNGRAYKLALTPDRFCDGAMWLYPADHLRVAVSDADLSTLSAPGGRLVVAAEVLGDGRDGSLSLELRQGGDSLAVATVSVDELARGVEVDVSPPVLAGATAVELHLRNDSGRFLLLTRAQLHERPIVPPAEPTNDASEGDEG